MAQIRMVDLQNQYLRIKAEVDAAIQDVLTSTAFIQGPQVKEFAKGLQAYTRAGFVIPCANGTDALQIAMMTLDLKPGDEVILPVHTYVATAEVIALLGLTPVFVDVDAATFNIDVHQAGKKITAKTRAIVPVHLYGQCADMEAIQRLAAEHDLLVIEDAAQALGAEFTFSDGIKRQAGTIGAIGTTSFFPSKNLGCYGDGGAIFTNDGSLAEKIAMISNHGQKKKYHHDLVGVNSRLDTLQAAILNVKLKYLNDYTSRRNDVATFYDRHLNEIKEVIIPFRDKRSTHAFHQYTLQVERRDELKAYLEQQGIPSMIYYPVPLHLQKAYHNAGYGEGSFPVAEKLSKTVISLPIHTEMTPKELLFISDAIKNFY
jgi:UDP-2-acetamido-2-deoxy-ribo-hexuluronate aminotransferase